MNFNPLSPHGERRTVSTTANGPKSISIHSPRMGRDISGEDGAAGAVEFQSTLPAWGETGQAYRSPGYPGISIHSPRMGRDAVAADDLVVRDISIHSPRMGRD